ncbi:MAG: hypothetical protein ACI9VI_003281 [Candidatus Azotimanducaceae bacterium]|jgi:hypothetical protein
MNPSARIRRSQSEWQQLVTEQALSELSIKAFCSQNDLPYASFSNWRGRLSKVDEQSPLIDLSSLMTESNQSGWLIELDLGNGIKLNLKQS